ncbi:MAG: LacI family transcriptional regulator [Oscillospiraceae bacterium]|nr:LacI family transcriptional regulator [Oscillospiraceae bacterium]
MQENVNIYDIAKYSGVSTSTVSRVLNGHRDVSLKTRALVLQTIKDYAYIPNNSARNLPCSSTKAVGVVVAGVTNPFFAYMISIIQTELKKNSYMTILQNHDPKSDADIVDTAVGLYKEKRPEGLLFLGGDFERKHQMLRLVKIPIVLVTTTIRAECERSWFSSITVDDEREAFNIANYICSKGHKRIAVIGNHLLRKKGLDDALRERGISAAEIRIEYGVAFSYEAGYLAAKRLLESGSYTCILCFTDILAIGAMKAIREKGLDIPGDISVIGFDGIEIGEYVSPMLTTVKQPAEGMARQSVSVLFGAMQYDAPHMHMVMPTTLIEGGSFGPAAE